MQTLHGVIIFCEALEEMSLSVETLIDMIKRIVHTHKVEEQKISRQQAVQFFVTFDNTRKSWTEEDYDLRNVTIPVQ